MSSAQKEKRGRRACPYCESDVQEAGFPFCKPCGVSLKHCPRCDMVVKREASVCPRCGGELEWK